MRNLEQKWFFVKPNLDHLPKIKMKGLPAWSYEDIFPFSYINSKMVCVIIITDTRRWQTSVLIHQIRYITFVYACCWPIISCDYYTRLLLLSCFGIIEGTQKWNKKTQKPKKKLQTKTSWISNWLATILSNKQTLSCPYLSHTIFK